jgi:hypothetical protein
LVKTQIPWNPEFQKRITDLEEKNKPYTNLFDEIEIEYDDFFSKPDPTSKNKIEKSAEHHSTIEKLEQSCSAMKKDIESFRDYIFGNEEAKTAGVKKEAEDLVNPIDQ